MFFFKPIRYDQIMIKQNQTGRHGERNMEKHWLIGIICPGIKGVRDIAAGLTKLDVNTLHLCYLILCCSA